jgi:hypothetical protein
MDLKTYFVLSETVYFGSIYYYQRQYFSYFSIPEFPLSLYFQRFLFSVYVFC